MSEPARRPARPFFSSGPCAKRPGWKPAVLAGALVGRSHRSAPGKARLKRAIDETRALLGVPDDHLIGIVPASDTGAVEIALWSLLGVRPVDVLAWESFGRGWLADIGSQLKLEAVRPLLADYGDLPDLGAVNADHDVVFTWNGTTSGVRVPDGDWIAAGRRGLTICDATSAAFAMDLPWDKLDVVTYSWQKVLGGEAAHGMLIIGPRAIERLESTTPPWPMPKLFRLTRGGSLIRGIFEGATINTPSMLCVEDYLDSLAWAREVGGLAGLKDRVNANYRAISNWVSGSSWVEFLATEEATRSPTSICLRFADGAVAADRQAAVARAMAGLLAERDVAYDIGVYRNAPPGLRLWGGATVETADLEDLLPWLDWAYDEITNG